MAFSCGNTTVSHYADVNQGCETGAKAKKRQIQGGREGEYWERAEVVGEAEADNMLSLCKTDRKAVIRVMESCCRGGGRERHAGRENYIVRDDFDVRGSKQRAHQGQWSRTLTERSSSVTDA